ncbi:MAG TPA: rhomboid family intramembrane serine protease [Spirochaetes bacterium]|nr:rhomboid family intramembrane serine protease [Spirochaetota bacterium]
MFIPYRDDNPTRRAAVVTVLLIVLNVAAFLYQAGNARGFSWITYQYGLIPAELVSGRNLAESTLVSPYITLFSYMFCHGGISHLLFNMLFLWIFGNNVEDRMSRTGFLVFYLLTGVISALAFVYIDPGLKTPLVGASGAVSAVLGAYLFMFPMARIYVWMLFFVIPMPALIFLPIWFLMQVSGLMGQGGDNVAWISHVAGFLAGIVLFDFFTGKKTARRL